MFEQPPEAVGPAFWIPSSSNRVENEAYANNLSNNEVGKRMATEIEEDPSRYHEKGRSCGRVR